MSHGTLCAMNGCRNYGTINSERGVTLPLCDAHRMWVQKQLNKRLMWSVPVGIDVNKLLLQWKIEEIK